MGKAKKIILVLVLILLAGGAVYTYVPLEDIPYVGELLGGGDAAEDRSKIKVISKRIKVTPPASLTKGAELSSEDITEEVVVTAPKVAKPTPKPRPTPMAKPKAKPAPRPAVTTMAAKRPAQKPYIVNVASFRTKSEALQVKDTLRKGGYNVYRTEFVKDGTKWHRIRVGFYPSRAEADKVSKEVVSKYGIKGGWITRPSWSEYDAYAR